MVNKVFGHTNKGTKGTQNPIERLKDSHSSSNSSGFIDQLIGNYDYDDDFYGDENFYPRKEKAAPQPQQRKEFTVFNSHEHYETERVTREVEELTKQIKQEVVMLKKTSAELDQNIKQVEKISLESTPEKAGIYHVRFLEIVISLLQSIREKVGDSSTWLTALISKKKKRGSLFAAHSKSKGTQYSLSQELQSARSIQ